MAPDRPWCCCTGWPRTITRGTASPAISASSPCTRSTCAGTASTTAGEGAGTLSQLSGDLDAFLRNVTGPAAVVGYSLGGTVGLRAATAPATLIGHLIAVATSSVVGSAAAEFFAGRIAQLEAGDT